MIVKIDSRRRVILPASFGVQPGETLDMEVLDDGRIVLVPVVLLPKHQLWAWEMESMQDISASLADQRPTAIIETANQAESMATRWTNED